MCDFISARLDAGRAPGDIGRELLDACLASDPKDARGVGCDNMTVVLVVLKGGGGGGGAGAPSGAAGSAAAASS